MVLVSDHDSEVGFGEDVVPLLTSTLHAVVQVVPRSCHRTVNLVNLSLCLPLGTHVGEEMHVVKWLMDGDVGKMENIFQAVECGWEAERKKQKTWSNREGDVEDKIDADGSAFLVELGRKISGLLYGLEHQTYWEWKEN